MLTLAKILIRVPEEALSKDLRQIANNVERFWYGCMNINDDSNALIPDMPSVRAQKAWYACIRGGFASRPYVYTEPITGKTIPSVKIWDLYNGAYEVGANGLSSYYNTYKASRTQIEKTYNTELKIKDTTVTVVDCWDETDFGVYVNDAWVQEPTPHGVGHCPIHIYKVGATPVVNQDNVTDSILYTGESVYASIRGLIPQLNKIVSDYLTVVHRGVKAPYVVRTQTGESGIDEDIWQVEKAAKIELKLEESITPLTTQTMPADAAVGLNWISGEIQRGSLPYTAYGELGFRLSGYAINQLQGSMETVLQPFTECLERSYFVECRELLQQYTSKQFKPVAVRGRNSKNQPFGYPTEQYITAEEIQGDWIPEITLTPSMPKDDAQRLEMARLATQGGNPLMSMRTARTEYMGLADADYEGKQVSLEWADGLIINRLYQAYMQAVEDNDTDRSQNILIELKRMLAQQQGTQGKQGQQQPGQSATEQAATENAGNGIPAPPTGMSASTMPPEELGGVPPGSMSAEPMPFER
jgi:hypothetical protein